jgi:hypothetical protein
MARRKTGAEGITISYPGMRELLQSKLVAQELSIRVQRAEAYARGIAPRGATGEYENSFYTRVSRTEGGWTLRGRGKRARLIDRHDRAAAFLGNDDPNAFQIEVGTKDTPAHHTLVRAATEAMGD